MSEITWNDLTTEEQDMVAEMATRDRISDPDCDWSQDMYDGLVAKGVIINSDDEYTFTPAGRALLPAGEAGGVANPGQNMTAEQLVEAIAEGLTGDYSTESVAVLAMEKLQKERDALQADLAAALARAQAAEGEAQRLQEWRDKGLELLTSIAHYAESKADSHAIDEDDLREALKNICANVSKHQLQWQDSLISSTK